MDRSGQADQRSIVPAASPALRPPGFAPGPDRGSAWTKPSDARTSRSVPRQPLAGRHRDERFTASRGILAGGLQAVRRGGGAVRRVPLAVSESGQLGVWRHDPHAARTEIHDQGGVDLDADDPAEAVRIVGNLIPHGELLSRRSGGRGAEGTSGQEAPGRGAGWLHHFQYAPAGSMRLPGRSPLVPPGGCTALPASRRICASA